MVALLAVLGVSALAQPAGAAEGDPAPQSESIAVPGADPVVVGLAAVGSVLTASVDWPADLTLTYQWLRDGVVVDGATFGELVILPSDVGAAFTVTVTGNGVGYDERVATSAPTAAVVPGTLDSTAPEIAGTPRVGSTLTASPGTWVPTDVVTTYQWFVGEVPVDGETSASYVPGPADLGAAVTVHVVGTRDGYEPKEQASLPTAPVEAGVFGESPVPTIVGSPRVGRVLTAVPGTWAPDAELTYVWTADSTVVGTDSTFTPSADQLGLPLTLTVTATRAGYSSETRSATTAAVASGTFSPAPVPIITGTPRVGTKLTAAPGSWAPVPTFTYAWKSGTTVVGTASTFTPSSAHLGALLTVTVTASRPGYATVTRTSARSTAVASGVFTSAPVPTVSGTVRVGGSVKAVPGTWAPTGALTYQWRRSGVAIVGATTSTYVPVLADAAKLLTVTVTGKRAGYVTRSVTSVGRTVGPGVFAVSPIPSISGTARVGQKLTAKVGTWSPTAALTYRWYRNGAAISGATASTYVVAAPDLATRITVAVTARRSAYTSVVRTSAPTAVVNSLFVTASAPTISGNLVVGAVVRATVPAWSPAATTLTYQWRANGVAIAGATRSTYTLTRNEKGKSLSVAVVGSRTYYVTATRVSSSTAAISTVAGPFKNCTEAWAAGAAPVYRGDLGYASHLDRDNDGIGCEVRP